MSILSITRKDLQILIRDRGTIFSLFILPVVFILLFGVLGAAAGIEETDDANLTKIPVVNLDPEGETALSLIDALNRAGGIQVELFTEAEAQELLSEAKIPWMLTIPESFSADVAADQPATLSFVTHPDTESDRSASVSQVILGVARDLSLEAQILDALEHLGAMQATAPNASEAFAPERLIAQAKSQFERSNATPLVDIQQTRPQSVGGQEEEEDLDMAPASVAGMTVLFVFLAAQTTAQSIYDEKKHGTFRRLLAAPLRRPELLGGKLVPNLITTLIQIVVIFGVGAIVFPLIGLGRLSIGDDPLAWALVSIVMALCSTSLGIFIVAIARTEGQVSSMSTAILWVAGIIGGAFLPTYFLPGLFKTIGKAVPQFWANQAYFDLLVRGRGLSDVTTEIAVLAGFTVFFFAVGLWRFEFD